MTDRCLPFEPPVIRLGTFASDHLLLGLASRIGLAVSFGPLSDHILAASRRPLASLGIERASPVQADLILFLGGLRLQEAARGLVQDFGTARPPQKEGVIGRSNVCIAAAHNACFRHDSSRKH